METKLSKLAAAAHAGDWQTALRIAAKFPSLGDQRDAIKRAHEAHSNPAFYQQIGKDPEALIAAGIEALKARYPKQLATLIDGDTEMTTTKLSAVEIAKLTAVLQGESGYKRSASKDAAAARFAKVAAEKGISEADAAKYLGLDFATAQHVVFERVKGGHATIAEVESKTPAEAVVESIPGGEPNRFRARKAALSHGVEPEPKPAKAPKKAKAAKATGKRAAILEAAQRGELPAAPDFSAETHKRFRPKLAQVVAAAEAGDLAALKAFEINPVSSSPKAIAKYRDLCVVALEARGNHDKAA